MDSLRKLMLEQANATSDIKRILINYKKLAKANITLAKTKSRLAELQALWKEVRYRHNDITFVATAKDRKKLTYFTQEEYHAAEDAYNKASDHLQEVIEALVTPSNSASHSSTDLVDDETQSSAVTLQRIPIPTFSGEFAEWSRFRHLFHSLVYSNKALTKIAKFHYLISSVAEAAAATLDRLNVSPENYDATWETLFEEYDNERELIRAHLRTIIRLPDGKLETAVELKKLKDTVRVALINVTNLGCQVDNWDLFLVTIMSEKFGPEMELTRNGVST